MLRADLQSLIIIIRIERNNINKRIEKYGCQRQLYSSLLMTNRVVIDLKILYTALIWSVKKFRFTALLDGIHGTSNLCILALKQSSYKVVYFFEGFYFGAIKGSSKKEKNPTKSTESAMNLRKLESWSSTAACGVLPSNPSFSGNQAENISNILCKNSTPPSFEYYKFDLTLPMLRLLSLKAQR